MPTRAAGWPSTSKPSSAGTRRPARRAAGARPLRRRCRAPTRCAWGSAALPTPGQSSKQPFVIPVALALLARDGQPLPLRLEGEPMAGGTERVLVLSDVSHTFTFVDIDAEPVPSLLRGFSAPVLLDDALSDADLRVLLQHDTDPFNRWEAGQRLLMQTHGRRAARRQRAAARRRQRGRAAHGAAPPVARRRAQRAVLTPPGESCVAEQLDAGRSAAHPRAARAAARAAGRTPARRLGLGLRGAPGARGLPADTGSGRPPRAVQPGARHAVRRAARSGDTVWPGRPTSASRTRPT